MSEHDHLTPMIEAAMAVHELYLSLVAGGFTEEQALSIVAKCMAEGIGK